MKKNLTKRYILFFKYTVLNKLLRELVKKLRVQPDCDEKIRLNELIVQIKGGRYEVNLVELTKRAIYWEDKKESFVRRFCLNIEN